MILIVLFLISFLVTAWACLMAWNDYTNLNDAWGLLNISQSRMWLSLVGAIVTSLWLLLHIVAIYPIFFGIIELSQT